MAKLGPFRWWAVGPCARRDRDTVGCVDHIVLGNTFALIRGYHWFFPTKYVSSIASVLPFSVYFIVSHFFLSSRASVWHLPMLVEWSLCKLRLSCSLMWHFEFGSGLRKPRPFCPVTQVNEEMFEETMENDEFKKEQLLEMKMVPLEKMQRTCRQFRSPHCKVGQACGPVSLHIR
jgi:hypothetical protein